MEQQPASAVTVPSVVPGTPVTEAPGMLSPGSCTVLVLGARGRLGYACVQAFAQAGWRVLARVRAGSALADHSTNALAAGGVRWIDTPLNDDAAWQALLDQLGPINVVVHAMAPQFTYRAWQQELAQLNHISATIAKKAGALLIVPVSVLRYGTHLPDVLFEDQPLPDTSQVDTPMGILRAQSEWDIRRAAESGVQVCTLRVGSLYGYTGDGWINGSVAKDLPQGKMAWLGPYGIATPWAYVHDLAQTMERIATQRHQLGGWTQLHFSGVQRTGDEWQQALTMAAEQRGWLQDGASLQAGQIHWNLWKPVGWLSAHVRARQQMEYIWRTPHRLDNRRLLSLIGVEPRTDWQVSVQNTIDQIFPSHAMA